ncbi:hypothetical protein F0L68_16740 [Solihabitans fulvus]|uniref:Uncharacterized protein n=1 Tax=Solihabitans fulvus TaxID=1892852 RepID=A0A5B2XEA5_9PSEU|nr:hypothetical protein [Solihabitans fulvus]KAA2261435.1 hypothetical protein F0L68_16740 [Solihabitans fulvus]
MRAVTRLPGLALALAAALVFAVAGAAPASAYAPVNIVHTERVTAGPYVVTIGFSVWPLHAMQSLDFTFVPDGGIADKSGGLFLEGPDMPPHEKAQPLARHPRKRDVWGLDVRALPIQGDWNFGFAIDGPLGHGEGALAAPVAVLPQPGPPLALSWSITVIPVALLVLFVVIAWRRVRPGALVGHHLE